MGFEVNGDIDITVKIGKRYKLWVFGGSEIMFCSINKAINRQCGITRQ